MSNTSGMDEIRAYLQSGDWRPGFDGARLALGEKLARKRLVRDLAGTRLESGDLEIVGRVADGDGAFDEAVVGIWKEGDRWFLEGSCSCEFATNCEHVAACLVWLAKSDRLVAAFDGAEESGESGVDVWLDSVVREPAVPKESADCLVYVLVPQATGVELRLLRGQELKAGGLGRTLSTLKQGEAGDLARDEDALILEELAVRESRGDHIWPIEGMGWELILKRLSLTSRLLSGEDSHDPMRVAEARNGSLGWKLDEGEHVPVVVTEPSSDYGFVAGGVWFVDEARRELGRVVIDDHRDRVKAWIRGPRLNPEQWEKLQTSAKARGVAVPGLADAQASVSESARLRIRVELGSGYQPAVFARAEVLYGNDAFPLTAAENRRSRRVEDENGAPRVIERDANLETRGLRELQALGLELGVDRADPIWKPTVGEGVRDADAFAHRYWQRFRFELGKLLEDRGWSVRYAPGVGHEPIVFRAEAWKAEIVEEGKGWFHLSAGFEIDGQKFELQPLLAALLDGDFMGLTEGLPDGQEFLFFLPDGEAVVLPVGRFRRLVRRLEGLMEFRWKPGQALKVHKTELAAVIDDSMEIELPAEAEEFTRRVSDLTNLKVPEIPCPDGLVAKLRDYQLEGYRWMQYLAGQGLNGILADDMGLGKTLQTLTHLLKEKESGRSEGMPNLIVAPTSVVVNWQREAAKFTPGLSVLILQGSDRFSLFAEISKFDLVLTSFALLTRDTEVLVNETFHTLVLDEAQHIKNRAAQVSEAARALDSRHRLCLSGTPVENHLGELWALMDFLNPGLLGAQNVFNSYFRNPIEREQDEARQAELNSKVGALILRRNKKQVAKELPPKTVVVHPIELSEGQKELYETVRATMDKRVRQVIASRGGGEAQIVFLDALLKLRQICCHPLLLDAENAQESAKFEYFKDMLATLLEEGHRTLVFSQFTSMLAQMEAHLKAEEIPYLILTGETKDRQLLVEQFQGGEGMVFLISLKAGGTGLTLTGADTVIHYDPWWNPAAENQATDRAYRIGQNKAVMVHKLICEGTVEQRIQQMQAKKGELADGILAGSRGAIDEELMSEMLAVTKSWC